MLSNYIIQKDSVGITLNKLRKELYYLLKIPQKISIKFSILASLSLIIIESMNTFLINKRLLSKKVSELL